MNPPAFTGPAGHCPQCGEQIDAGWRFCPACEAPLAAPACPACGRAVKSHWKRCPDCGAALSAAAMPPSGTQPDRWIEPVTGMDLILVPGGSYEMGDASGEGSDDERPRHLVHLAPFYLGKTPVTQEQWLKVMPSNPSQFQRRGDLPVERVDRQDVQQFITRLAERSGHRFRLPSEAEWEYAARSGGRDELYAGGLPVADVAWYEENSGGSTQPVGRKRPNGLGLHDMCGNVWEWCQDHYSATAYADHEPHNPLWQGPGRDRVIRGGSWHLDAWSARCTRRFGYPADFSGPGLGFRLVRELA
jgi:formylglycine-generating enzyme required for sulfatase activity